MQWPRLTLNTGLMALLGALLLSNILYTRESLTFCEKALFGEVQMLQKETRVEKPVSFREICPEVRQRAENAMNKWLEIILALLVNPHPPAQP